MSTQGSQPTYLQLSSPFPEGWYFITSRQAVLKARLMQKTWMGEKIVVWCDENGHICVAGAYCPHLGADLGPGAGGRVCGGRLVCPFHGFEFDAAGQCVATPFAPAPRTARLQVFETQEILGLIFAWWGIDGRAPRWNLPTDSLDQTGWCDLHVQTLRFPGHPQEVAENSVDLTHLQYVHGYDNVNLVDDLSVEGHFLENSFDFKRTRRIAGIATLTFDVSARTQVFGLGYSFVEIHERTIGMDLRLWVLATPVDGTLIDLSLVGQTREIRNPKRPIAGLRFLPTRLRAPILNRFMALQQRRDVQQDMAIWSSKKYSPRPRLCASDEDIMAYRAYCAQFYPDNPAAS